MIMNTILILIIGGVLSISIGIVIIKKWLNEVEEEVIYNSSFNSPKHYQFDRFNSQYSE